MSDPFAAPSEETSFGQPRRRWRLRRLSPVSVGLFTGAAGAIVGLLAGLVVLLISGLGISTTQGAQSAGAAMGMGALSLIMLPLFYGVTGFIGGVINAFVYNLLAGMTGGIEFEMSEA